MLVTFSVRFVFGDFYKHTGSWRAVQICSSIRLLVTRASWPVAGAGAQKSCRTRRCRTQAEASRVLGPKNPVRESRRIPVVSDHGLDLVRTVVGYVQRPPGGGLG